MVTNVVVEEIVTEFVEACTESPRGIVSVTDFMYFDKLYSTVQHIMRRVLSFNRISVKRSTIGMA